jgi:hypothetical protein
MLYEITVERAWTEQIKVMVEVDERRHDHPSDDPEHQGDLEHRAEAITMDAIEKIPPPGGEVVIQERQMIEGDTTVVNSLIVYL